MGKTRGLSLITEPSLPSRFISTKSHFCFLNLSVQKVLRFSVSVLSDFKLSFCFSSSEMYVSPLRTKVK